MGCAGSAVFKVKLVKIENCFLMTYLVAKLYAEYQVTQSVFSRIGDLQWNIFIFKGNFAYAYILEVDP